MDTLEQKVKEKATQAQQDKKGDDDDPPHSTGAKKRGRPRKDSHPEGVPEDQTQRNFTDPESRIMKSKDGFIQAYNVQSVVDEECQIIVATDVTGTGQRVEVEGPHRASHRLIEQMSMARG